MKDMLFYRHLKVFALYSISMISCPPYPSEFQVKGGNNLKLEKRRTPIDYQNEGFIKIPCPSNLISCF